MLHNKQFVSLCFRFFSHKGNTLLCNLQAVACVIALEIYFDWIFMDIYVPYLVPVLGVAKSLVVGSFSDMSSYVPWISW
jgi:hypothetical protein